jgi:hypothetical protein
MRRLNKIALISSFCDTEEKVSVLIDNIKKIKSYGIDTLVISPISLGEDVILNSDYVFYTKDNFILDWPEKAMSQWAVMDNGENLIQITRSYPDYGYAGLYQIKQSSMIALGMDYDQFFHIIYDIKIDDNVIDGFISNKINSVYPSKRNDTVWDVGLHYMIFDRKNLTNFIDQISKESYMFNNNGDAFTWLFSIKEKVGYHIESIPVEDLVYYYDGYDFFNFSPTEKFKFFIEKDDEKNETIKLLFYQITESIGISISVNDEIKEYNIKNLDLVDLFVKKDEKFSISFSYGNTKYDLTDIIKNVKHNTLKFITKNA